METRTLISQTEKDSNVVIIQQLLNSMYKWIIPYKKAII